MVFKCSSYRLFQVYEKKGLETNEKELEEYLKYIWKKKLKDN
jgi:hypothetical protein